MAEFDPNKGDFTYLFGGGFDESLIKLSITHDDLDPTKITAALRLAPTKTYRKGDVSDNKKRIMKHGMWQLATPWIAKIGFEENLSQFLSQLPDDRRVWRRLAARYKCELTVVLRMRTFNRGAEIPSAVLRELFARSLGLNLDVYFDDDAALCADKKKRKSP